MLNTTGAYLVANGYYHTLVVLQTGGVKTVGYNTYGQLGNGTTTPTTNSTPITITLP